MLDTAELESRTALRRNGPLRAFKSERDAYKAGRFFLAVAGDKASAAWCEKNGQSLAKAHGEGTNTSGGYLVPSFVEAQIIALRELAGCFRLCAQVVPIASDVAYIPKRTGGLTVYYVGEGAAVTEANMTIGNITFSAKKLATLVKASDELSEDSVISLGDFLAAEIAFGFATAEDAAGWNGDGTATYAGIIGVKAKIASVIGAGQFAGAVDAASGVDTFAEITATDLASLVAALPDYALAGAKWFCSAKAQALVFCRLAAGSGGIGSAMVGPRQCLSFWGFPIVTSSALPTSTGDLSDVPMLYFGDLSLAAALASRGSPRVAKLEQLYAGQGQVAFLGRERYDIVVHSVGDATNAGPIVALIGE